MYTKSQSRQYKIHCVQEKNKNFLRPDELAYIRMYIRTYGQTDGHLRPALLAAIAG